MMTAKQELLDMVCSLTEKEAESFLEAGIEGLRELAPLGCPSCNERHMDALAWTDDDCLTCCQCQTTFDPNATGVVVP